MTTNKKKYEKALELFFKQVNLDTSKMNEDSLSCEISGAIMIFPDFVKECEAVTELDMNSEDVRDKALENVRDLSVAIKIIKGIKKQYTAILKSIHKGNSILAKDIQGVITLSITGTKENDDQSFVFSFLPSKKAKKADDFPVLVLLNLISFCKLEPGRFGICEDDKCKKHFYQLKSKKMAFCSDKCTNRCRAEKSRAKKVVQ